MPPERTAAARSRNGVGSGFAEVHSTARRCTRSGSRAASRIAVMPAQGQPDDVGPLGADLVQQRDEVVDQVVERYGPAGAGDSPCPRVS